MTVRRTAAALVVVPLFALASCGGDPHKPPPYTPSPTPTESTSPTPTGPVAPTLPTAAKQHTRAGAEAYVRYYVDVLNHATATVDPPTLAKVTSKDCQGCQNILGVLRDLDASDSVVKGGVWTIKSFGIGCCPQPGSEHSFLVVIDRSRQVIVDGNGERKTYKGGEATFTFDAAWSADSGWRLTWLHFNG
ncbi:MAG TPA: DUF6318 family protein [Nocardioides sp.]|jgi:hypothetical protein